MKPLSSFVVILSLIAIPTFANVVSAGEVLAIVSDNQERQLEDAHLVLFSGIVENAYEPFYRLKALQIKTRRLTTNNWKELLGNVWTGVKVYYGTGTTKAYGFEVLGGSEKCPTLPSGRGIFVRYEDGSTEWKDRKAMINPELFFILRSDPALKRFHWRIYRGC